VGTLRTSLGNAGNYCRKNWVYNSLGNAIARVSFLGIARASERDCGNTVIVVLGGPELSCVLYAAGYPEQQVT
jgi:hypothetical protein